MCSVFRKKRKSKYTISAIFLFLLCVLLVGCGEKNPHQQTDPVVYPNGNVEVYPHAGTEDGTIIPEDEPDTEPEDTFVPDCSSSRANIMGNTMTNLYNTFSCTFRGYLARQDLWTYYSPRTGYICKYPVFDPSPETVVQVVYMSDCNISCINVIGDWIYFLCTKWGSGIDEIWKVRTDGSMLELVTADTSGLVLLVYDHYMIFGRYVQISASEKVSI